MSIFLAVVLTVSGSPDNVTSPDATPAVKAPAAPVARNGRELSDAAHAALRKWAKASDKNADAAARTFWASIASCSKTQSSRIDARDLAVHRPRTARSTLHADRQANRERQVGHEVGRAQTRCNSEIGCRRGQSPAAGAGRSGRGRRRRFRRSGRGAEHSGRQWASPRRSNTEHDRARRVGTSTAATAPFTIGSNSTPLSFAPPEMSTAKSPMRSSSSIAPRTNSGFKPECRLVSSLRDPPRFCDSRWVS